MSRNKQMKISDVLDSFTKELETALKNVNIQFENKIVMGYETFKYNSKLIAIKKFVETANAVMTDYSVLLGKAKSDTTILDDLQSLLKCSPDKPRELELRLRYLDCRNITIKGFPFKKEKLAEVYDYPAEHEALFQQVLTQLPALDNNEFVAKYFKREGVIFEFSDADEKTLLTSHTKYATIEDMRKIMSLHLFCEGLSNLKGLLNNKEYSFKDLPEIDYSIMRFIKIDKDLIGFREVGISVNIDAMNNPDHDKDRMLPGIGIRQELGSSPGFMFSKTQK